MEQVYTVNQISDSIFERTGVFGLYGRPATGKSTRMLQVVGEINKRKAGTALIISLEASEAFLRQRMQKLGISNDRVVIDDTPRITAEHIESRIKQVGNVSILGIDYLQLLGNAVREQLPRIAAEYGILILAVGVLDREYAQDKGVYLWAQNGH